MRVYSNSNELIGSPMLSITKFSLRLGITFSLLAAGYFLGIKEAKVSRKTTEVTDAANRFASQPDLRGDTFKTYVLRDTVTSRGFLLVVADTGTCITEISNR